MRWWTSTAALRAPLEMVMATPLILLLSAGWAAAESVTVDRAARLDHLLRHDCGSCHGMTMKGGLGPALLPANLKDRDDDGLVEMILHGNPQRAMPPWGKLLSKAEAAWIVRRLKHGLTSEGKNP